MKLEQINNIAKTISSIGENKNIEVYVKLDDIKFEQLQQEVFKFIKKTIHGYSSKNNFEIIINDIRFIFNKL